MIHTLAELAVMLGGATLAVLLAAAPLVVWPLIRVAWLRFEQNVAYTTYALHRLGMPEDEHRWDLDPFRPDTETRQTIAYGELPWYCVAKAGA